VSTAALADRINPAASGRDGRSCTSCRRHRASNDVLRCTEQRSNAVGGVVVVAVSAAKKARTYEQIARNVADRCKYFQEEV
jgi:hypothetical protein